MNGDNIQTLLRLTKQGTYRRRLPPPDICARIKAFIEDLRSREEEWSVDDIESLSLAHEAILDYPVAISLAERAMGVSGSTKKRMLRLSKLREAYREFQRLPLSPFELQALYTRMEGMPLSSSDLPLIREWIRENHLDEDDILRRLTRDGKYRSDAEVFYNVIT